MEPAAKELLHLLKEKSSPIAVKESALNYILGLISTSDGLKFIVGHEEFLNVIAAFIEMKEDPTLIELAHKCLLNAVSSDAGSSAFFSMNKEIFVTLLNEVLKPEVPFLDFKCKILSNATRYDDFCEYIAEHVSKRTELLCELVGQFNTNAGPEHHDYDSFAMFLGNISRNKSIRSIFLTDGFKMLESLTSYTTYPYSEVRRYGVVVLLKNICFEIDHHEQILGKMDILSSLMLPLIGPDGEYEEDEMDMFPIVCQYLGFDKKRESNLEIRVMLLEALLKLCTTRYGRDHLRKSGVYFVLRQLHKWESELSALKACENVIEILIRDETDIDADNLMNVSIPENISTQLKHEGLVCNTPGMIAM